MSKIFQLYKKFEYFTSIDEMPIYNWLKIQESNDLTWVMKVKGDATKKQLLILEDSLKKMTDEYIDTFGISDSYRKILRLRGEIACMEVDYCLTQQRSLLTFINVKKKELESIFRNNEKSDSMSVQVHVRKYLGQSVNMRETSVKEYYSIIREIEREQKQNQS